MENPFILEPYKSKDLFCDRETETRTIISYLENGRNITLISPRRLGKTGLIYRVFEQMREDSTVMDTFYVDISSTVCLDDFIKLLSESVISVLNSQTRIANFFRTVGGIRPVLSYNEMSGKPEVSWTYRNDNEKKLTLQGILAYLEKHRRKVVLAIDDFQQIREYPGVEMEALLRTYIQPLHNVRFIFCGSKKHTMTDMFSNAKKPFYESTSFVSLGKLDLEVYTNFIIRKFSESGKKIELEQVERIIEWTRDHTFYTQSLCNEVFRISPAFVTDEIIHDSKRAILDSNKDRFLEIQRLLTPAQWKLMKAIAKEDRVWHPTSSAFISKYTLGSGPAVLKNLKTLMEKELILAQTDDKGTSYCIYNVFLSRYLESL